MPVARDQFDQYAKPMAEWSEVEWKLFSILEEIPTDDNEDKTITAYMADILDILEPRPMVVIENGTPLEMEPGQSEKAGITEVQSKIR